MKPEPASLSTAPLIKNIVISGTNFWNPGDDFVRDGVVQVLRQLFPKHILNFLFYNFNADFFPQSKFAGISNLASRGDLERYRDFVDAIVIAGLSAGSEIKDLYQWVIDNGLEKRVYLIGAGYENQYVAHHISQEPEATIFRNARIIIGRTAKTPAFVTELGLNYLHLNCPAILSVKSVKNVPAGKMLEKIGFSIQLPDGMGLVNHSCPPQQTELACKILVELSREYSVEVVAHHKSEYFSFLKLLQGTGIPVIFSSFYQELHDIYPRYDLMVTTRLHASLFANGFGIPGIIINDTDRHTHTLEGFPHSKWVNNLPTFHQEFNRIREFGLERIAREAKAFKQDLMRQYESALAKPFGLTIPSASNKEKHHPGAEKTASSPSYRFDSEQKEQMLVHRIMQPGMIVLDVGANIGKYTRLFSSIVGEKGKVVAFEPSPGSAQRLESMIAEANLQNVTLIKKAVCERSGSITLHQFPEEYCSWNSLGRPQMQDPRNPSQLVPIVSSVEIESITLDEFCRQHQIDQIDYLKLDVEGAEIRALAGARELLRKKAIKHLQFEISRKMLEGLNTSSGLVFEFLMSMGYVCHEITPEGKIGQKVCDSSSFYENYVALPVETSASTPQRPESLPIHFFTIVINGMPFLDHHIHIFKQLPFRWHWHIIEGIADQTHDTSWTRRAGGRIPEDLQRNGLSTDGTTEYLDQLARQHPENVTIYRKPSGAYWDGKLEMVNAPLSHIRTECLLWEIDVDELWTADQIHRARKMFLSDPNRTAAFYLCHFFVGKDLVITSRNTYGNHLGFEWIRTWRFKPGDRWTSHEPPQLCRISSKRHWQDLAALHPFRHHDTEALGLIFQHYAYTTEAQLRFKEVYYGYAGAVQQWKHLQAQRHFPVKLADYFGWVKDATEVNTIQSQRIQPLAPDSWFQEDESTHAKDQDPSRILYVRTDSIGDAILASAMMEPLRRKFPRAQLAVLCQEHIAELYLPCPHLNRIICFDIKRLREDRTYNESILGEIREFAPDLVLNSIYSREWTIEALLLNLRGVKAIGMEGDLANISAEHRKVSNSLYTQLIPNGKGPKTELDHHGDFLNALGISPHELKPQIWTTSEDEAVAQSFFEQNQLDPANTIALFPGSLLGIKVYPHWGEALRSFAHYHFLIFGGAEATPACEQLALQIPGRCTILTGRTTLREMASLMKRCRLYVGVDSSGAHIACAVGLPNVVVYGGGQFGRFFPYSSLTSAVVLPLDCFQCNWLCKFEKNHCIRDIQPRAVAEAMQIALTAPGTKPRVFVQTDFSPSPAGGPHCAEIEPWLSSDRVEIHRVGRLSDKTSSPSTARPAPSPLSPQALTYLQQAESFFNSGDLASAAQQLEQALRHSPDSAEMMSALGRLQLQLDQPEAAHGHLQKACSLQPANPAFHVQLAAAAQRLDRIEEYESEMTRALELDPENIDALRLLIELNLQQAKYQDAAQTCARLLRKVPEDIPTLLALAKSFHHLGELAIASETYHKILQLDPSNAMALKNLGLLEQQAPTPKPDAAAEEPGHQKDRSTPKITAIISTYNSERFIRGCLEDLEAQTIARDLEIIVIDSASPQKERAIVEEFQKRYSNIVYIRSEQRETIYAAWNHAIQAARGQYITNANTDDRHRRDALEILARTLDENSDIALVYADCLITRTENETFETAHPIGKFEWLDFSPADLLNKGCFVGPQPMWRRAVHEKHGYFDPSFVSAGDYEFWLRIAHAEKFLHVKQTLGLYLQSPSSIEHSNQDRAARETQEAIKRYGSRLTGSGCHQAVKTSNLAQDAKGSTHLLREPVQFDPNLLPPCARIGDLSQPHRLLKEKKLREAWEAAWAALQMRPFHPEAYLLLARIALAAGDSASARRCARQAREMVPGWKPAKQFLKGNLHGRSKPDWLKLPDPMPPGRSNDRPRLSVCLIVKNEEQFLGQCLASIKDLASQIVVVDTGSTDRTVAIAQEFGTEVYHFTWCDDFSAARNAALEHANGDWVLMLDADEELPAEQHGRLLSEIKSSAPIGYRLPLVNQGKEAQGQDYVPRLFRNVPGAHYTGRIHEQVFPSLAVLNNPWGLRFALGTAQLLHHGYTDDMNKERNKNRRNLSLLRQSIQEEPNNPHIAMSMGLELVRAGDLMAGLPFFQKAFVLLSNQPPFEVVPELRESLLSQYSHHLFNARFYQEVVDILTSPLASQAPLTSSMHFVFGAAFFELKQYGLAVDHYQQCLKKISEKTLSPASPNIFTARPYHGLAVSLANLGLTQAAEEAFQEGLLKEGGIPELKLDYAKLLHRLSRAADALHQLHDMVAEDAHHREAWRLGGVIALGEPSLLAFACDWTEEAVRYLPDDSTLQAQRAEALLLSQDTAKAREWWDRLVDKERDPQFLAASILCGLMEEGPLPSLPQEDEAALVSQAFMGWYGKLMKCGASELIKRLNACPDKLQPVLPAAARFIAALSAEVERPAMV